MVFQEYFFENAGLSCFPSFKVADTVEKRTLFFKCYEFEVKSILAFRVFFRLFKILITKIFRSLDLSVNPPPVEAHNLTLLHFLTSSEMIII